MEYPNVQHLCICDISNAMQCSSPTPMLHAQFVISGDSLLWNYPLRLQEHQ